MGFFGLGYWFCRTRRVGDFVLTFDVDFSRDFLPRNSVVDFSDLLINLFGLWYFCLQFFISIFLMSVRVIRSMDSCRSYPLVIDYPLIIDYLLIMDLCRSQLLIIVDFYCWLLVIAIIVCCWLRLSIIVDCNNRLLLITVMADRNYISLQLLLISNRWSLIIAAVSCCLLLLVINIIN